MKYTIYILVALLMSGCASDDYARYTDAHTQMQIARSSAEAERYKALSEIAKNGAATAQVAAVIAMMQVSHQQNNQQIAAPKSGWDSAREWAAIIVPSAASAFGIYVGGEVAKNSSNNSRDTAISTNNAFVNMAGKIQSPAANVTSTTNTATNTTTSTDSHAVDSHAVDDHSVDSTTTVPTTVVPTKICTANPTTGVTTCQ